MSGERARICVVGDVLADTDVVGRVERLSPEAPVPVVDEERVAHRPGGAGLAATVAVRHGVDVTIVTALGDDGPAGRLRRALADERIDTCSLPWTGTTVEKIRIGAPGVPLLRLDRGQGHVAPDLTARTVELLTGAITGADAVLVADYGRGVGAHPAVRRALSAAGDAGVPVVWDPHPRGPAPVLRATLVCPNRDEAERLVPEPGAGDDANGPGGALASVIARARALHVRWDAGAVAVTLGADGAVLVLGDGAPLCVPVVEPTTVVTDTCGAGDAFAAAAAVALSRGAVVSEAAQAAVLAATSFVADGGAAGMSRASAAAPAPTPLPTASGRRQAGGATDRCTLVATGGCFDILHPGHVHTLQAARCLGDRLVVLVNDDASVRRLKGPDRPLQPVEDRRAVLESIAAVDEVIVFSEDTPVEVLRRLRPSVFVKGGDYTAAELPETAVLAGWGGTVVTVPFLDGRSTTELLARASTDIR